MSNNEWYTPAKYIEAARTVMGGIDLDPASCELANRVVQATRYFSREDNGLVQAWKGRVWLNPPFGKDYAIQNDGRGRIGKWVRKLIDAYAQGDIQQAILRQHGSSGYGSIRSASQETR